MCGRHQSTKRRGIQAHRSGAKYSIINFARKMLFCAWLSACCCCRWILLISSLRALLLTLQSLKVAVMTPRATAWQEWRTTSRNQQTNDCMIIIIKISITFPGHLMHSLLAPWSTTGATQSHSCMLLSAFPGRPSSIRL